MPQFTTNDGVKLTYQDAGSGKPLVIIPGWSQTASMFKGQVDGLSGKYRVIVLDLRGHGESEKPGYGYRITRLSKDVHDLLTELDLKDVTLMGWSMGCSVVWGYWDLFGAERLAKIILIDEPAFLLKTPEMSEQDVADAGALWDAPGAIEVYSSVRNSQEAFVRGFVPLFLTSKIDDQHWLSDEVLKMPARHAADLVLNHVFNDWRDVIPRINIPVLIFGATKSHVPVSSQQWIHKMLPHSRLEVFEGRAHLMFYEVPEEFNRIVADFVG